MGINFFHFHPLTQQMAASIFPSLNQAKLSVSFVHTSSLPTLQLFTVDYPEATRAEMNCVRVTLTDEPMDLQDFGMG